MASFGEDIAPVNPFQSAFAGYQAGNVLASNNQKIAQQQQQMQQQMQMRTDLAQLSQNPNMGGEDIGRMIIKYPELSEHYKRGWDVLEPVQQQAMLEDMNQAHSALVRNKPDVAIDLLTNKSTAYRNNGEEDKAGKIDALIKSIEIDPAAGKVATALAIAAVTGPEKYAETFAKIQSEARSEDLAPAALTTAQADAQKAAVTARFAESEGALELKKLGADIAKVEQDTDVAKLNKQIAAAEVASGKTKSALELEKLTLQTDKLKQERDDLIVGKQVKASSMRREIDNTLANIKIISDTPRWARERAHGTLDSNKYEPTLVPQVKSYENAFNAVKNQLSLMHLNLMKQQSATGASGLGATNTKELEMLGTAITSLELSDEVAVTDKKIKQVVNYLNGARDEIALKFGSTETQKNTLNNQVSEDEFSGLMNKFGPK